MLNRSKTTGPGKWQARGQCSVNFSAAGTEAFFPILDAVAWLEPAEVKLVAQFAGVDLRSAERLLRNCETIGLVRAAGEEKYALAAPYPYGGQEQKLAAMREALVKMPLTRHMREFIGMGDSPEDALRKAATLTGVVNYHAQALEPLMKLARHFKVLAPKLVPEKLIEEGTETKRKRPGGADSRISVYVCYNTRDRDFVRRLASDLVRERMVV